MFRETVPLSKVYLHTYHCYPGALEVRLVARGKKTSSCCTLPPPLRWDKFHRKPLCGDSDSKNTPTLSCSGHFNEFYLTDVIYGKV
ncbi:hypothetical protein B5X24_HaOG210095 [Helicoverpa armigera]|nr:hypothetical protein B5X24_HaOG210095 [Helicoverpa armigera]